MFKISTGSNGGSYLLGYARRTCQHYGKIIDSVFYNDQGERIRWKQFEASGAVVFENEYDQKNKKSPAK